MDRTKLRSATMTSRKLLTNQKGWTLVEIITTLIIIAISALFAAPEIMDWRANMRLSSAARDFYAALNNARVSAVEQNANIAVDLNTANTAIIFVDDGGAAGLGAVNGKLDIDGGGIVLETVIETIAFNNNSAGKDYRGAFLRGTSIATPIGFTPKGMAIGGNTGNLLMSNADNDDASNRWFKIELKTSGSLSLFSRIDLPGGSDGTWK